MFYGPGESWTSPCPISGLGIACEGQQVAPSWFCEPGQAGAQAGQGMGQVTVLALPVCCSGGPGSVCWCCGSVCCAAGAALPCVILCSGLISLQRSCTNGCSSSEATRCCQWPWEMTSMTWGKSPEGWQGGLGVLCSPALGLMAGLCAAPTTGLLLQLYVNVLISAHNPPVPGPGPPVYPGCPKTPRTWPCPEQGMAVSHSPGPAGIAAASVVLTWHGAKAVDGSGTP